MNIYFCHIPKCAGLSVKQMLEDTYGVRACYDIKDIFLNPQNLNGGVYYGHGLYCLQEILPKPLYTFTMLRDPIDRILSYWKHIQRDGPAKYPRFSHLITMPFSKAIRHLDFERFCNGQTTILGAQAGPGYALMANNVKSAKQFDEENYKLMKVHWGTADDQMLARAKNVLHNMRFGFQEQFEKSMRYILAPLKIRPHNVRINVAPESTLYKDLSANDICQLRRLHKYDLELYKFAQNLFDLVNP